MFKMAWPKYPSLKSSLHVVLRLEGGGEKRGGVVTDESVDEAVVGVAAKKGGQRHTDVKIITTKKDKTNSCFLLVPTLLIWINAYFGWLRIAWWSVPIDCCNGHSNMLTGKIAQVQDITQAALWDEMVDYCKYWHLSLLIICKSTEGVWQRTRGLVIQQASACTYKWSYMYMHYCTFYYHRFAMYTMIPAIKINKLCVTFILTVLQG